MPSAPLSSRVSELLDALRAEYDSMNQESSNMRLFKDEFEQRGKLLEKNIDVNNMERVY